MGIDEIISSFPHYLHKSYQGSKLDNHTLSKTIEIEMDGSEGINILIIINRIEDTTTCK